MSGRQPRSWLEPDQKFGQTSTPRWKTPTSPAQRAELRLAQIQHEVVLETLCRLPRLGLDRKHLAPQVGLGYDQFARVMRGEDPMTLLLIAALDLEVGPLWPPRG